MSERLTNRTAPMGIYRIEGGHYDGLILNVTAGGRGCVVPLDGVPFDTWSMDIERLWPPHVTPSPEPGEPAEGVRGTLTMRDDAGFYSCRYRNDNAERRTALYWDGIQASFFYGDRPVDLHGFTDFIRLIPAGAECGEPPYLTKDGLAVAFRNWLLTRSGHGTVEARVDQLIEIASTCDMADSHRRDIAERLGTCPDAPWETLVKLAGETRKAQSKLKNALVVILDLPEDTTYEGVCTAVGVLQDLRDKLLEPEVIVGPCELPAGVWAFQTRPNGKPFVQSWSAGGKMADNVRAIRIELPEFPPPPAVKPVRKIELTLRSGEVVVITPEVGKSHEV